MKIEGYEEISREEYYKLPEGKGATFVDWGINKPYYFKKAQKFPICFEDKHCRVEITENYVKLTDVKEKKFKETEGCGDYLKLQEERENNSLSEKTTKEEWHKAYNKMCQKYGKLVRKYTDIIKLNKEKIQNVQRRLKHKFEMDCQSGYIDDEQCECEKEIDKIFLEEIGGKILK